MYSHNSSRPNAGRWRRAVALAAALGGVATVLAGCTNDNPPQPTTVVTPAQPTTVVTPSASPGPPGPAGAPGASGAHGAAGTPGAHGAAGTPGAPGAPGVPGASAPAAPSSGTTSSGGSTP